MSGQSQPKVAVLVNGELRQFDIAYSTWRFKDELNCDFYFSTWDTVKQSNANLDISIEETISEKSITKFIPNANIQIFNRDDYDFPNDTFYHNDKFLFHIKNSYIKMKQSGIDYDFIMMTRPDNYKTYDYSYEKFKYLTDSGAIYGLTPIQLGNRPSTNEFSVVVDYLFFGTYDTMSKMIESLPNSVSSNIHVFWAHHFMNLDLYVKRIDGFNLNVLRPNIREKDTINMHTVHQAFIEWGHNTGK